MRGTAERVSAAQGQETISLASARVNEAQFKEVRELAYRTFGLDLKQGKEALVSARLAKRISEHFTEQLAGLKELVLRMGGLAEAMTRRVVQALVQTHGVAAGRLQPFGVGPTAPVASNDTDEGRAKNRRGELVKQ